MQDKEAAREQSKAKGKAIKVFIKKGVKGLHVVYSKLVVMQYIVAKHYVVCNKLRVKTDMWQS